MLVSVAPAAALSVDTSKSEVARKAVEAGAVIINDIWGLKADPALASVAAETESVLIIMHNQKGSRYANLLPEIFASLSLSKTVATDAGVPVENIILDPGIGFGKTPDHNLEILHRLKEFKDLGYPLLIGTSRKSTIGKVLQQLNKRPMSQSPVQMTEQLVNGTAATVALSIAGGADIVRVHDVKEIVAVCRTADAVVRDWKTHPVLRSRVRHQVDELHRLLSDTGATSSGRARGRSILDRRVGRRSEHVQQRSATGRSSRGSEVAPVPSGGHRRVALVPG